MSVALHNPMSQEEFFAWAERQDGRYEFDGVQPVAMTGGTNNHGFLADNIRGELWQRLRGSSFRAGSPDGGGVETTGGRIRYPEAVVTGSAVSGTGRTFPDPIVVFEVISESTRRIDQVSKLREYHAVPSIKRYVVVEQSGPAVTVHARHTSEPWATTVLGDGDVLAIPEIGIEIPLSSIYQGVVFDPE